MFRTTLGIAAALMTAAPAWAEDVAVQVTKQDCARLVHYTPSADVAYKPGVDVHGKPVAPADLPGSGNSLNLLPDVLEFNIPINPVTWAKSKSLNKQKATTQSSIASNETSKQAAKTQVTTLTATKSTLQTTVSDLSNQINAMSPVVAALKATANTTHSAPDIFAYEAKAKQLTSLQSQYDTANASLTSTSAELIRQQAIVDAAPTTDTSLRAELAGIEGKQSSLSGKGMDNATMNVAAIKYDISKGTFLINGEPLGTAEQQAIAEACAKRGIK
ncbi:MAG: hypothetical protein ACM31L_02195 [Actinomycetota bacterium]